MSARAHCNTEYRGFLKLAQRLLVQLNGTPEKVTGQQPFYRVCNLARAGDDKKRSGVNNYLLRCRALACVISKGSNPTAC